MKHLFLIRGVSGSGKSTTAKAIAPNHNVAADDFFIDPATGTYNWVGTKTHHAHQWCLQTAEAWMVEGATPIAVHNTFTNTNDLKPYVNLAELWGYQVFVLIADGDYTDIHDVPKEHLKGQARRFRFNNRYLRMETER